MFSGICRAEGLRALVQLCVKGMPVSTSVWAFGAVLLLFKGNRS